MTHAPLTDRQAAAYRLARRIRAEAGTPTMHRLVELLNSQEIRDLGAVLFATVGLVGILVLAVLNDPIPDPLWILMTAALGYYFGRQSNGVGKAPKKDGNE